MRKFLAVAGIALLLGACALTSLTNPMPATTTVDLQKGAYAAKLTFQGALILAVAYIETPRCDKPTSPAICSKQAVVDVMRKAIIAADNGTQAAEDAARALNADNTSLNSLIAGSLGALVTAAEKSVTALQTLTPAK